MPAIEKTVKGNNGVADYTEYTIEGIKRKVVVQNTGAWWYIYDVAPGQSGAVKTIGSESNRNDAEKFAQGYITGMRK